MAPFLILTELQTGAWLRRGQLHALTLDAVRNVDPWSFGADLIVGSLVVGGVLGVLSGTATYFVARTGHDDPWFVALVRRAADRYVSTSITAWEFARGKLRGDPLYRTVLTECSASFGRDTRRRRLRSGAHAGVARRVRSGVARGDLAVVLAAASGVRPARRHRDAASRRGDRPPGARRGRGDRRR